MRAVAERAGVNERTVYRYFPTERELRDAVLGKLEQEAGVDLTGLRLEDLAAVTGQILDYVSTFPLERRTDRDATIAAANERQRQALLGAVAPLTAGWSEANRVLAAAMFDVLWSVVSYERLVEDWHLDPKEAIRGVTWLITVLEEAIRNGRRPD